MTTYIKVFRKDIATKLIQEGYNLLRTEQNKFNNHLSVFVFAAGDGINKRLEELK